MSPLWRDEIAIYIAPRKIALARREKGLRPQVGAATEVAVPNGHFGDIRPTFAKLAEVLSSRRGKTPRCASCSPIRGLATASCHGPVHGSTARGV